MIGCCENPVDDDGDGVAVWDEYDEVASPLYARPVTRRGGLGDVRRIAPGTHDVRDANVAMRPRGRAVITWVRLKDASYSPWARTFSLGGRLGPAMQIGRGPNAGAPGVDVDRDGDALVTWNRQQGVSDEAWGRRVSRTLSPLGRARRYSRTSHQAVNVEADMDFQGDAVVAWHVNYFAGVFARRVRLEGTVGPIERLGNGGLGGVFLDNDGDGGVAWFGYTRDGLRRSIRVTRVARRGGFGATVDVGRNGYDTSLVGIDGTPRGRMTVSWEEEPSDGAHVMAVRGR